MQFSFKFGIDKETGSKIQLISVVGSFWQKIYKIVFLIFLIGMIIFGGYIWQSSLSGGGWSAEKKQEYLNAQNSGVVFKENDFKKALADLEMRKQYNAEDRQELSDIFKAY